MSAGPLETLSTLGLEAGRRMGKGWKLEDALELCAHPSHSFGPTFYAARLDGYRVAHVKPDQLEDAATVWWQAFEEGFLAAAGEGRRQAR